VRHGPAHGPFVFIPVTSAPVAGGAIGAGASVIGAIAGSAGPLGRELAQVWQLGVLGLAGI
jgi:hypothetical protein